MVERNRVYPAPVVFLNTTGKTPAPLSWVALAVSAVFPQIEAGEQPANVVAGAGGGGGGAGGPGGGTFASVGTKS